MSNNLDSPTAKVCNLQAFLLEDKLGQQWTTLLFSFLICEFVTMLSLTSHQSPVTIYEAYIVQYCSTLLQLSRPIIGYYSSTQSIQN